MAHKSYFIPLYCHINKYKVDISHYLLQNEPNTVFNTSASFFPSAEYFAKYAELNKNSFVWEIDITKIIKEDDEHKIIEYLDKNLENHLPKGSSRKLLKEFFVSILKFCKKHKFSCCKTRVLLAQCYNTHQYFASNLWMTPEEIYSFFKELILCHCVLLPPDTLQTYVAKECKDILVYFHSIYIKNLPLIKLLMFPNYGYILKK